MNPNDMNLTVNHWKEGKPHNTSEHAAKKPC